MKRKQIIRDKFWTDAQPNNNLDFVEVSLPDNAVDDFVRKYAKSFFKEKSSQEDIERLKRKKERLVRKILRAGSLYFTDRQWQVFIHRWIGSLKEVEIAERLHVNQSYVSSVLKACHIKLQKVLGMKDKKYLRKKFNKNEKK